MQIAVLGIDIGKNSCSVSGLDASGKIVLRRRLRRESVIKLAAGLPTCIVAMESCCGAHHLGRMIREQGHQVRLMSPEYVRPYVKSQKNDDRDAEAIAEAATRPTMRFVELKNERQLDMQSLHRVRDRLVGERTALINQLRALLLERGTTVPQGRRKLEVFLDQAFSEHAIPVSERLLQLIKDIRLEWRTLDRRIEAFDREFVAYARGDEIRPFAVHHSRHRRAERNSFDSGDRQCRDLWTRAGSRRLAGSRPQTNVDRRQAAPPRHQQTGQLLSAKDTHPWRPRGLAHAFQDRNASGRMASSFAGSRPRQHGRRSPRSEVGTYCLGSPAKPQDVRDNGYADSERIEEALVGCVSQAQSAPTSASGEKEMA